MKAYQIVISDQLHYTGTKPEAQKWVKDNVHKADWPEVVVHEVDVQTDKEGVIAALNSKAVITTTERAWGITPRGALKEEHD